MSSATALNYKSKTSSFATIQGSRPSSMIDNSSHLGNVKSIFSSQEGVNTVVDRTQDIKVKVAQALLNSNLNLLAALCLCTFVGDAAVALSNSVISLLKQIDEDTSDRFVRRVLRTKTYIYVSKGRRMADLLRDNYMSTMILTSYTKSFGHQYLKNVLQSPMDQVGELICEPVESQDEDGNVVQLRMCSEENIIKCCELFLQAILKSKDKMPKEFRKLCNYLRNEIEYFETHPPPKPLESLKEAAEDEDGVSNLKVQKELYSTNNSGSKASIAVSTLNVGNGGTVKSKINTFGKKLSSMLMGKAQSGGSRQNSSNLQNMFTKSSRMSLSQDQSSTGGDSPASSRTSTKLKSRKHQSALPSTSGSGSGPFSDDKSDSQPGSNRVSTVVKTEEVNQNSRPNSKLVDVTDKILPPITKQLPDVPPPAAENSVPEVQSVKAVHPIRSTDLHQNISVDSVNHDTTVVVGDQTGKLNKHADAVTSELSLFRSVSPSQVNNQSVTNLDSGSSQDLSQSKDNLNLQQTVTTQTNLGRRLSRQNAVVVRKKTRNISAQSDDSIGQLNGPAAGSNSAPNMATLKYKMSQRKLKSQNGSNGDLHQKLQESNAAMPALTESSISHHEPGILASIGEVTTTATATSQPTLSEQQLPQTIYHTAVQETQPVVSETVAQLPTISIDNTQVSPQQEISQNAPQADDFYLSGSERVIGTLIFLRFFVPAITAPDTYNILNWKMTPVARKGLIQVGKILNGFCSDADFKLKEPNMQSITTFLESHKGEVKQFIQSLTVEMPRQRSNTVNQRPTGLFLPDGSQKRVEADDHMLLYLSRSIGRIDSDLDSIVPSLPQENITGVYENFTKLKAALQPLVEEEEANNIGGSGKIGKDDNLISRLGKRISNIRFSSINSASNKSRENLSTGNTLEQQ
ncbi:hypothetical protein MP228_001382 [Amoeboaphelidium protococcarum]|nr:hypothetical protein MP228_001382 [Amoeboaphelidium protococcarum]